MPETFTYKGDIKDFSVEGLANAHATIRDALDVESVDPEAVGTTGALLRDAAQYVPDESGNLRLATLAVRDSQLERYDKTLAAEQDTYRDEEDYRNARKVLESLQGNSTFGQHCETIFPGLAVRQSEIRADMQRPSSSDSHTVWQGRVATAALEANAILYHADLATVTAALDPSRPGQAAAVLAIGVATGVISRLRHRPKK